MYLSLSCGDASDYLICLIPYTSSARHVVIVDADWCACCVVVQKKKSKKQQMLDEMEAQMEAEQQAEEPEPLPIEEVDSSDTKVSSDSS